MLDGPATYPLLRGRRKRRRGAWLRRVAGVIGSRGVRIGAAIALLAGIAIAIAYVARRADAPDAAVSIAHGRAALARANYSAARNDFIAAVRSEPDNTTALIALAQAYLLLEDGVYVGKPGIAMVTGVRMFVSRQPVAATATDRVFH